MIKLLHTLFAFLPTPYIHHSYQDGIVSYHRSKPFLSGRNDQSLVSNRITIASKRLMTSSKYILPASNHLMTASNNVNTSSKRILPKSKDI